MFFPWELDVVPVPVCNYQREADATTPSYYWLTSHAAKQHCSDHATLGPRQLTLRALLNFPFPLQTLGDIQQKLLENLRRM